MKLHLNENIMSVEWLNSLVANVDNVLNNRKLYPDVYWNKVKSSPDTFVLCVEINDGDWSHDHNRIDFIVREVLKGYKDLELIKYNQEVTDSDDSDTYSAIHKYYLKNKNVTTEDIDKEKSYGRYMVYIRPYKDMFRLDYIDSHFDKSDYCFFDKDGYMVTNYAGIPKSLFDKLYNKDMKPGKVYKIYTNGPYGKTVSYEEVPMNWFHL